MNYQHAAVRRFLVARGHTLAHQWQGQPNSLFCQHPPDRCRVDWCSMRITPSRCCMGSARLPRTPASGRHQASRESSRPPCESDRQSRETDFSLNLEPDITIQGRCLRGHVTGSLRVHHVEHHRHRERYALSRPLHPAHPLATTPLTSVLVPLSHLSASRPVPHNCEGRPRPRRASSREFLAIPGRNSLRFCSVVWKFLLKGDKYLDRLFQRSGQ